MKILYCTNFYTDSSGGVKTYLHALERELVRRGLPFRLVVPGRQDACRDEPEKDSRTYVLRSPRFPVNREYRMILPLEFLPQFRFRLGRIIARERPDVVEVSDLWTIVYLGYALKHRSAWFGLEQRPLVSGFAHDRLSDYMIHYFTSDFTRRLMLDFSAWYLRKIYLPAYDVILANSEYTEAELLLHMDPRPSARRPRTSVVPLGVDVHTFSPDREDSRFRRNILKNGENFIILYVGRLSREKGLDRLAGAMRLLGEDGERDVRLLVVGDGERRTWLENLGLPNVTLLGYESDTAALARIYASSDAFITPSVREGFGIAQLEAMSCGLPVICPEKSGHMSFMDERIGVVSGSGSTELAGAIRRLRDMDDGQRRKMGREARSIALDYSWEETTNTILDIYRESLEEVRAGEKVTESVSSPVCTAGHV